MNYLVGSPAYAQNRANSTYNLAVKGLNDLYTKILPYSVYELLTN